jgi:hypothetical protein
MKNISLIREISPNFQLRDGTILVDSYNPITGEVTLGTIKELAGKVVTFEEDPIDILNKLNAMHVKIHIQDKSRYEVNVVLAKVGMNESMKAYIII